MIRGVPILVALLLAAPIRAQDPYGPIKTFALENGLTVVLAPSGAAKTFEVELRFLVGWTAETRSNQGVAQLAERVYVRDLEQHGEQTFQQRVREAGGEASGSTNPTHTSFYASVPSIRGIWVLNEMSNLLPHRKLTKEAVDRARRELLNEVGEARPFFQSFLDGLVFGMVKTPDFFETEFRVPNPRRADTNRMRKDLLGLTLEQCRPFTTPTTGPATPC
jgi:Predicted Zn-dependent peptidases